MAERGTALGVPYRDGEKPFSLEQAISKRGWEILWECGYRKAGVELIDAGEERQLVKTQLLKLKDHFEIVEKQDVVTFPNWLEQRLQTEFRVKMYTDERKHRGRPHVAAYLKNGKISASLEDPQINLTPSGGLVGEAKALKVIKKNRKALLQLWDQTRVDSQQLI